MKDCISLGVGEPDFVTPWNIREAGINSLRDGITCYSSNAGLTELRQLICEYYEKRFNVSYRPDQCLVTVGASEGIDVSLRILLDPGDEVLIPEPSYVSYSPCVTLAGGVPRRSVTPVKTASSSRPNPFAPVSPPAPRLSSSPIPTTPPAAS